MREWGCGAGPGESGGDDFAEGGGFVGDEVFGLGALFEEEEVGGESVGFEGFEVVVEFGDGEAVGSVGELGDFEAAAAWFFGEDAVGFFCEVAEEVGAAAGGGFDGDDEGDHGRGGKF